MISIRKFLQGPEPDAEQRPRHVIQLLLQGIALHAVEGDPEEYREFRENMRQLADSVDEHVPAGELVHRAGRALQILETHNLRTDRYYRRQNSELQNIVEVLTHTVGSMAAAGDRNLIWLREIESQLASATEVEDLRLVKRRLHECLNQIRTEADRQRFESRETAGRAPQGVSRNVTGTIPPPAAGPADPPGRDGAACVPADEPVAAGAAEGTGRPATLIPERREAEAALAECCRTALPCYVLAIALDRIPALEARLGKAAAAEALLSFCAYLQNQIQPEDRLFRWSTVAVVALLIRPGGIEGVRGDLHRVLQQGYQHKIRLGSHSIHVALTARWAVFPMLASADRLIETIDSFTEAISARE